MDGMIPAQRLLSLPAAALLAGAALSSPALAQVERTVQRDLFDSGRLLATAGVTQLEGAGGGGLAPWALITGYGTRDAIGANAHYTTVPVSDFTARSAGVAVGLFDRLELSYARISFDTEETGALLGLGEGFTFHQDVFGAKLRLFGDAVYDQDSWIPQVAVGVQHKRNDRGAVVRAVGAEDDSGTDFYLAATKLFLDQCLLLNGTIRLTEANQLGLLGFGGDAHDGYTAQFEGSAALLLNKRTAIGVEYRTKPDNLGFAEEDDWFDAFVAFFPSKHVSLTAAYADLGSIATQEDQRGVYFSVQVGF